MELRPRLARSARVPTHSAARLGGNLDTRVEPSGTGNGSTDGFSEASGRATASRVARGRSSGSASVPSVGAVVEVRYLYAVPDGSLNQPVYLGVRHDVEPHECVVSQLKFKRDEEEV